MPKVRRALLVIVVIFVIYAVINDPTKSADVTNSAWQLIKDAVTGITDYFDRLIAS